MKMKSNRLVKPLLSSVNRRSFHNWFIEDQSPGACWTKSIVKTDILLIRHAQSANNCIYDEIRALHGPGVDENKLLKEEGRLRHPDSGLSKLGDQQVDKLKTFCKEGGFAHHIFDELRPPESWGVLSSPMQRCLHTTRAISEGLGKTAWVHPLFYEYHGCYQDTPDGGTKGLPGSTAKEVEETFPGFRCLPGMESGWYKRNAVESPGQFRVRVDSIVESIWQFHETAYNDRRVGDTVGCRNLILVIHGNLMSAILSRLQRGYDSMILHNNTGVSHVQLLTVKGHRRVAIIKAVNRTDHFRLPQDKHLLTGAEVLDDHWIQEYWDL